MIQSKLKADRLAYIDESNDEFTVLHMIKNGISVSSKSELKNALSKFSSTGGTIIVVDEIAVDEDITIPENVQVGVLKSGLFNVSSGKTLTINGPIEAGLYQVFSGDGTVDISKATKNTVTVENVQELVSKTKDQTGFGCDVNVLGYHEAGDGGGGIFYWDADEDKANHNGGTIIDPTQTFPSDWSDTSQQNDWFTASGTGSGCWKRIWDNQIDVKWFGAKGDGETDDTQAIQKAINLLSDGDILFFPLGTYKISNRLHVPAINVTFNGVGDKSVIDASSLNDDYLFYGLANVSLTIQNLVSKGSSSKDWYRCGSESIWNSLTVSNCRFENWKCVVNCWTTSVSADNLLFIHNKCQNVKQRGILIKKGKNLQILHNSFEDFNNSDGESLAVFIGENDPSIQKDTRDIWIEGNYFSSIYGDHGEIHAILVEATDAIIRGNIVYDVSSESSEDCEGIYGKLHRGIVQGNILVDAGEIEGRLVLKGTIDETGVTSAKIIVKDNIIIDETSKTGRGLIVYGKYVEVKNNLILTGDYSTIHGIQEGIIDGNIVQRRLCIPHPSNLIIVNNIILSSDSDSNLDIRASDGEVSEIVISNNFLKTATTGDYACGVRLHALDHDIQNVLITGNRIEGNYGVKFVVAGGYSISNVTIKNNIFDVNEYCNKVGDGTIQQILIDIDEVATIPSGESQPSVIYGNILKTNNSSACAITGFRHAKSGQRITVIFGDSNTTVDFTGTTLKGNNGVDWSPSEGDHMTCIYDGTNWYCNVSDNTA